MPKDAKMPKEYKLVKNPKFKPAKVKFNGKYFRKRLREIRLGGLLR